MNGSPLALWVAMLCVGIVALLGGLCGWVKRKTHKETPNQNLALIARWMPLLFGVVGLDNLAVYMGNNSLFEVPKSFFLLDFLWAFGLYCIYVGIQRLVDL